METHWLRSADCPACCPAEWMEAHGSRVASEGVLLEASLCSMNT